MLLVPFKKNWGFSSMGGKSLRAFTDGETFVFSVVISKKKKKSYLDFLMAKESLFTYIIKLIFAIKSVWLFDFLSLAYERIKSANSGEKQGLSLPFTLYPLNVQFMLLSGGRGFLSTIFCRSRGTGEIEKGSVDEPLLSHSSLS